MSLVALDNARYEAAVDVRDAAARFHGNVIIYVHWEEHLSFCAALAFPLAPDMPFGALVSDVIAPAYKAHPDAARIDWSRVEWQIDGRPAVPDFAASLAANGLGHKTLVRFWTPGLDGWKGSAS